ncbi:MAG: MBL fold metallo-hydrolase [Lachnospiraceae bacterium]|nr:MBL fold metallo-hydrolase [Lachnospiraceae bacterium]
MDEGTWIISFMNGTENMYLLEGDEKALLIDTGYGAGNLRAFVEKLTDKPVLVANTHFHPDHAGGNGEFERVFVSPGWETDAPSVYGEGAVPFDLAKLPFADYEKITVGDGYIFELGGRKVEVLVAAPAHCNSSLFFLDREHRMLFTGDEYESAQTLMYDNSRNPEAPYNVKERLDNLKANGERLKGLEKSYDFLFPNHNGCPIAKEYLNQYIELVDGVYAGTAVIEDKLNHPFIERDEKASALCRVRWKNVSIFIRKDLLMTVYGK